MNATITVTYNGQSETIELEGTELSAVTQSDGRVHRYLGNGSKDYIGERIEKALLSLTADEEV